MDQLPAKSDPGYADALCNLAKSYYYGWKGLEEDKHQSFRLWKEAAEMDHLDSIYKLGECYREGFGCEKDLDLAFYWYKKAAEKDDLDSIYKLGECYRRGLGCEKDLNLAFCWYEKAAQRDNVKSMLELGACYRHGHGCKQDSGLALEWWKNVAQREDGPDQLYGHGLDTIDLDYSVGYGCLSTALKHGHKETLEYLMYHHQQSVRGGNVDEKIQKLRKIQYEDPSDFIAVFLLAECLSNSFKLKDLDEATSMLATIPQDVTFYSRSQWLVPFLEEKKNIICLSAQSGQSFPTESDYIDPKKLKIVALIGEGQFGKVYLAKCGRIRKYDKRRWVAVKYLNDNEFVEHQDAVTKLMRERLANQILKASHSRNTAKYMGIVTDFKNKKSGLVFELCADLSLVLEDAEDQIHNDAYVGGRGKLDFASLPDWRFRVRSSLRSAVVFAGADSFSISQLLEIFRNVAIALQCLHILGILHRDIADRNVLCDGEGNVQLADFGMARFFGVGSNFDDQTMLEYSHKLTEGHQYAVAWWAPECLGEKPVFSFASDVYSFFIMVWQCLANEDPFQSLLEGDGDPFVRISGAILRGHRPDLDMLRRDTPIRLRKLMEDSLAADPAYRPTLATVISELDDILNALEEDKCKCFGLKRFYQRLVQPDRFMDISGQQISNKSVLLRIRGNHVERKWFAVQKMYLEMPHPKLIQAAQEAGKGSFEASFLQRLVAAKLEKAPSLTVLSDSTIGLLGGRRPYDVFIVHAGEEKWVEASTIKNILELAGFRCFLDRGMEDNDRRPVSQMAFALETCRYVVAVVSEAFLLKKYPCRELKYAFDRAQWLEGISSSMSQLQSWRSLRIVLLDVSVVDYSGVRGSRNRESLGLPPLPALGQEVIMKEFQGGRGKIEDWVTVGEQFGEELLHHDQNGRAVDHWHDFLKFWDSLSKNRFPRAGSVYCTETESEIEPVLDFTRFLKVETVLSVLVVLMAQALYWVISK